MSIALRKYLQVSEDFDRDFGWRDYEPSHVRYARKYLPFKIQYTLYFASHKHRAFVDFVKRVPREIRSVGEDPRELVRFDEGFAMASKDVVVTYPEHIDYERYVEEDCRGTDE